MYEVRNKQQGPIQLIVKSRRAPRSFTCKVIPGVGKGKNVVHIEDELMTEYIGRLEQMGLISTRYV